MRDNPNLLRELRSYFSGFMSDGGAWRLDIVGAGVAYVFRLGDEYGVAMPFDGNVVIHESFSGITLTTRDFSFDGRILVCLALSKSESKSESDNRFVLVCYDFLLSALSDDGDINAVKNPYAWWEKWKELVGNAEKNQEAYSVLAEMIVLDMMAEEGTNPVWEGITDGTVDIRSDEYDCEVKSSKSRYNNEITVSGQFQLRKTERVLHLRYVCFEETGSGLSINDMIPRLKAHGMDEGEIECRLEKKGYEKGRKSRTTRYAPLRIWDFVVDETFPYVDESSFVGGHLPRGLTKFQYTLELSSLNPIPLEYPIGRNESAD